jgi:hypothetical protein
LQEAQKAVLGALQALRGEQQVVQGDVQALRREVDKNFAQLPWKIVTGYFGIVVVIVTTIAALVGMLKALGWL